MNVNHVGNTGEVTMAEFVAVLRSTKTAEMAGIAGKVVGVGLFVALLYSYGAVLIETFVSRI